MTRRPRLFKCLQKVGFNPMKSFIEGLPKAELHLHIEGSFEPELMFSIAKRNKIALPFADVEAIRKAYEFTELQDFLDIYYQGMSVLQTKQDFFDLTWDYLQRVHKENVRHVEIFFDPQGHTSRAVAFETVIGGITEALDQAKKQLGMSSGLIMCFLRHLSEKDAYTTLDQAMPHLDRIIGVGLDSSENGNPPEKFAGVFAKARELGLKIVAHAGEEGPPEYIRQAVELLKVDRIDHGNRILESAELTQQVAKAGIPLTVCPLSNLKLCVVKDLKEHPIRKMLEAGLKPMLNSDDPSYFGGYMNANYLQLTEALGLSKSEIVQLAKNSFEAAFISGEQRDAYLEELNSYSQV